MNHAHTPIQLSEGKIKIAIARLAGRYPFHIKVLEQFKITAMPSVETMGVTVRNGEVLLLYNPQFVLNTPARKLGGVLLHEVHHIVLGHVTADPKEFPDPWARTMAEEVTVNEYIKEPLPDGVVTLDLFPDLPLLESTAERYKRLKRVRKRLLILSLPGAAGGDCPGLSAEKEENQSENSKGGGHGRGKSGDKERHKAGNDKKEDRQCTEKPGKGANRGMGNDNEATGQDTEMSKQKKRDGAGNDGEDAAKTGQAARDQRTQRKGEKDREESGNSSGQRKPDDAGNGNDEGQDRAHEPGDNGEDGKTTDMSDQATQGKAGSGKGENRQAQRRSASGEGENRQDSEKSGQGTQPGARSLVDNHDVWQEAQKDLQAAREAIRDALVQAVLEAGTKGLPKELTQGLQRSHLGIGTEPGAEQYRLMKDRDGHLDWRHVLRRYVGEALDSQYAMTRPPRRFPELVGIVPARERRSYRPKVMAIIDTSGSISDEMLEMIDGELRRLAKDHEVTVVECDVVIHKVVKYRRLDVVSGRGGTDFHPPLAATFLGKHRPNVVIYFTDGFGPAPEQAPTVPVIWCLVHDGVQPVPWGRVIEMEK